MRWQKRARLGIAIFGVAFAVILFFAVGERVRPEEARPPARLDPKAIAETSGSLLQRLVGMRKDFTVACGRSLYYENQDVTCLGVRIDVKGRHGRDFIITSAEARANEKEERISLSREVTLRASDGFEVSTESAIREHAGLVRTPAPVRFRKGDTMSGGGVGMTYDENADVLTIAKQARVQVRERDDSPGGEFSAETATFARLENYLALEGSVHATRGEQTIDADRAVARLTENDEAITSLELRGNARVAGGSTAFDSMSARDIDIFYAADGATIERVLLTGSGAIALKAKDGAAGHRMLGESLTITLAADGSVTSAVGRDGAQLDLAGGADAPARQVQAKNLDVSGEPGKGMTGARFRDDVQYHEQGAGGAARTARSRTLTAALDDGALTSAVFAGQVHFEEKGLAADASEARYQPRTGLLQLRGGADGGGPRVSDERIRIEADIIDITLEGRQMTANGSVKTLLRSGDQTPGLLNAEQPSQISAASLQYRGDVGHATYTGGAQLWQGQTSIRGDRVTIDQQTRNLGAAGNARATFAFGAAPSIARADTITYDNTTRHIILAGTPPPKPVAGRTPATPEAAQGARASEQSPATPATAGESPPKTVVNTAPAVGAQGAAGPLASGTAAPTAAGTAPAIGANAVAPPQRAQMTGPEGDLTADRIVIVLDHEENRLEQLEAYDRITLRVDTRLVTGARMTYYRSGRYDMTGTVTVPVRIVESCRETTGRALTFFRSADNIIIDGNEEIRTRTTSGGPCPQPPP